jgi:hypothetical protein
VHGAPLHVRILRQLDLGRPPARGRPSWLSSASGLVRCGGELYVAADDELSLGRFPVAGNRPGDLLRLFAGTLPLRKKARKQRKADLEILLRLPSLPLLPHGALLALGSGSSPNRRRGALVALDARGKAQGTAKPVDAAPLYAQLEQEFDDLNLEGGWLDGDSLCLLQRGNRGDSPNAVIELDYAALATGLAQARVLRGLRPRRVTQVDLGKMDGVPLGFTDACRPASGLWLYSAVAEDTADARADGDFVGAVIGLATRADGILWQRRIAPPFKVEGIDATLRGNALSILCVTDADDQAVPAQLLRISAPVRAGNAP